jgi:ATP-dependent helicase HrpA
VQDHIQTVGNDFERDGITVWDFGDLPETYELQQNGMGIRAYPALVDQGNTVSLKLYDNLEEASVDSLRGMVRLVALACKDTVKYLRKQLLKGKDLGLSVVAMGSREAVVDDIICAAIKQACFSNEERLLTLVRDKQAFTALMEAGRPHIVEVAEFMSNHLTKALAQVITIKKIIKKENNPLLIAYAVGDIQQQLERLFYQGMVFNTPLQWLQQYPRYMQAIIVRLEKVPCQVNKDRALMAELAPLQQRWEDKVQLLSDADIALNQPLQDYRWMLEELRISFFAQTLKTRMPVSAKRLNKQWELC